ncbi:MAG: response regulator [Natronomonas sp.]
MSSTENVDSDLSADGTLLMVEDDPDMLETFRLWVSDSSFTLRTAKTGREAVERFSEDVDAILTDRRLPDFSAAELLDQIDEDTVPVAVVSAHRPDQYLDTDDVTLYLTKPVSETEICDAIETLLAD